jgi:hypothetical protein
MQAHAVRMEACSEYVAWHTAAMNDCVYEVNFVGTFGPYISVRYTGATRAGGSVIVRHQAAAAHDTPRLLAAVENVRTAVFRDVRLATDGIGFDDMAVLSGNPAGPPTTMTGLCFSGLGLFTLNANDVTIPTSRAIGFVFDMQSAQVDAGVPKELFIAAEGSELRPVVVQFDAAENVLNDTAPVLFSNANAVWVGSPSWWWETNVNLDQLSGGLPLFAWQRVTLAPACRYAFVGVRGGSATARAKALRIYGSPMIQPQLLAGGARDWGQREMRASAAWTVPSLAAGATATFDITVPGVRGGDFVEAGFAKTTGFQNGGVVFHAVQGGTAATNQVRVTAQNVSGGTIVVDAGTLFVRGVRPRV